MITHHIYVTRWLIACCSHTWQYAVTLTSCWHQSSIAKTWLYCVASKRNSCGCGDQLMQVVLSQECTISACYGSYLHCWCSSLQSVVVEKPWSHHKWGKFLWWFEPASNITMKTDITWFVIPSWVFTMLMHCKKSHWTLEVMPLSTHVKKLVRKTLPRLGHGNGSLNNIVVITNWLYDRSNPKLHQPLLIPLQYSSQFAVKVFKWTPGNAAP